MAEAFVSFLQNATVCSYLGVSVPPERSYQVRKSCCVNPKKPVEMRIMESTVLFIVKFFFFKSTKTQETLRPLAEGYSRRVRNFL
jgi:hypothetical protein